MPPILGDLPNLAFAVAVLGWTIRIAMTPLVAVRQRRAVSALAWLAVIFFTPFIGVAAYFLIGERRLGRKRLLRRIRRHGLFEALRPIAVAGPDNTEAEEGGGHVRNPDVEAVLRLARRFGSLAPTVGNRVEFLDSTEAVVDRLVKDLSTASRRAYLLYYMFRDDQVGRPVADALMGAARRGVECRLLVDDVGSRELSGGLESRMRAAGVDVRRALPVSPWRLRLERLDARNHRKLAIIDGRVALTGSHNIAGPESASRTGVWRDVTARVEGSAVRQLQHVFVEDWFLETDEILAAEDLYAAQPPRGAPEFAELRDGPELLQVTPSGPDHPDEGMEDILSMAVLTAKSRVIATTPYFIPGEGFMQALRLAAARGARVDLIVPEKSDHPVVDVASRHYYGQLLSAGVRVWLHGAGLLHAKTLVVDDRLAWVGSANFDVRSFRLNFELGFFASGGSAARDLARIQEGYAREARELTRSVWLARPRLSMFSENLVKVLSPLL